MLRQIINKNQTLLNRNFLFNNPYREMHSRNKKSLEYIAKGYSAIKEVDRVIDYCELNDTRLIPLLGNDYVQSDQQAFYYLEKAVDQLQSDALYLLGDVYLTGDCVKKDVASTLWRFHRASEKKHAGAAVAYGSLLLRGAEVPESLSKFIFKRSSSAKSVKDTEISAKKRVEMVTEQFRIAATAGCNLGLKSLEKNRGRG